MKYCWKYHFKYVLERTVYPLVPFSDYTTLILYWASPQNMVCKYLESKSSWYNNNLLGSVLIYIVKMILTSVGSNVPLPWGRPSNTFRTRGQFPNKDIDLVSYSYRSSQIYQHGDPKFGPLPPPSRDSISLIGKFLGHFWGRFTGKLIHQKHEYLFSFFLNRAAS